MPANLYTFQMTPEQNERLVAELAGGNYVPRKVPYTVAAAEAPSWGCNVALYTSGKCVVQGKGAKDFVENVMEPVVLREIVLSQNGSGELAPPPLTDEAKSPHIGVDESGKGDYLGPLVIAAVYTDETLSEALRAAGAQDSKAVASDRQALQIAERLRSILGPKRYSVVLIGNPAYNRLYARMRSVNRILSWAHAKAIGNVLDGVPDCPMAISDQFGTGDDVRRALRDQGRTIELRSRPKAESDVAVGAASLLAREAFLHAIAALQEQYGGEFPKGATHVRGAAEALVRAHGPKILLNAAKAHFRTTDQVLAATGHTRLELPPEGQVVSVPFKGKK